MATTLSGHEASEMRPVLGLGFEQSFLRTDSGLPKQTVFEANKLLVYTCEYQLVDYTVVQSASGKLTKVEALITTQAPVTNNPRFLQVSRF